MQRYLDDVQPEKEETAFVLHVCYWEGGDKVRCRGARCPGLPAVPRPLRPPGGKARLAAPPRAHRSSPRPPFSHLQFWPDYVSFLRNLAASARHVVVLTCPVAPGWRDAKGVAARNADLRRLMTAEAKSGGGGGGAGSLRLLDAAAIVEGAPLHATKADNDVHYQAC